MAYMRLGDLLVASGVISQEQLGQALELQKETRERLGDLLVQHGFITEQQRIEALKIQLGVEFVDLTAVSIPVELAQYMPKNIAKKYCVVPVKLVRDALYLAMSDPLDFIAQEEVKTASRKRVIPMIATRRATEQAIRLLYGSEGTARVIEEMKRGSTQDIIPAQLTQEAEDAGYSMAQSFENNAPYLPRTFIETVRAGEESGTMELCFDRLHRYYDRSARTRAKISSALIYPAMVLVMAVIVFVIIIAVAAYSLRRAPLRRLHTMSAAGRFANTMSTMLAAGLSVPRALDVTGQVVGNYVFALAVSEVKQGVERGRGIAESMSGVLRR